MIWLVLLNTIVLTNATWWYGVIRGSELVMGGLTGLVTLIGVPLAAVGTLYQLSKLQDNKHQENMNGSGDDS
jgi:hypothetical protein